ncbi:MAG: HRDC domain-containing protein [Deltaproteobacteria bacterium]|nr:HRDC domain-containing protein [Deltaproteobacteria bacterium]
MQTPTDSPPALAPCLGLETPQGAARPEPGPIAATRPPAGGLPPDSPEAALFAALRPVRRQLAANDGFPSYFVLSDAQLAHLCQVRPANFEVLAQVHGVGPAKLVKYGVPLLAAVRHHAADLGLQLRETLDVTETCARPRDRDRDRRRPEEEARFARGESLGDLCVALSLAPATVVERLLRWVLAQDRPTLEPWVRDAELQQVRQAAAVHGLERLKPLYDALHGDLHYPYLRLAQGYLQAEAARAGCGSRPADREG